MSMQALFGNTDFTSFSCIRRSRKSRLYSSFIYIFEGTPILFSPVDGPYTLEYIGCTNWSQCIIFLKDMKLQGREARMDLRGLKGTFFKLELGR